MLIFFDNYKKNPYAMNNIFLIVNLNEVVAGAAASP